MNSFNFYMVINSDIKGVSKKKLPLEAKNRADAYEVAKQKILAGEVKSNALWVVEEVGKSDLLNNINFDCNDVIDGD